MLSVGTSLELKLKLVVWQRVTPKYTSINTRVISKGCIATSITCIFNVVDR